MKYVVTVSAEEAETESEGHRAPSLALLPICQPIGPLQICSTVLGDEGGGRDRRRVTGSFLLAFLVSPGPSDYPGQSPPLGPPISTEPSLGVGKQFSNGPYQLQVNASPANLLPAVFRLLSSESCWCLPVCCTHAAGNRCVCEIL